MSRLVTLDPAILAVRRELALLRIKANRALDPLFAAIADQIDRLVMGRAVTGRDWVPRLDTHGALLALTEIRGVVEGQRDPMVLAIGHAVAAAEDLADRQAARVGIVASTVQRVRDLGMLFVKLGGLVRGALDRIVAQVSRVLTRATETAQDARDAVTRVERYLSPKYAPYRDATGKLVRDDVPGALDDWPAASGMAVVAVTSIAWDQLSAAHGERVMTLAAASPGVGVQWVLSPAHTDADECEGYAEQESGYGAGVYVSGTEPDYPAHRNCACTLVPVPLV